MNQGNRFAQNQMSAAARIDNAPDDILDEEVTILSFARVAEGRVHVSRGLGVQTLSAVAEFASQPGKVRRITGMASLAEKLGTFKAGSKVLISGRTEGTVRWNVLVKQPFIILSSIGEVPTEVAGA